MHAITRNNGGEKNDKNICILTKIISAMPSVWKLYYKGDFYPFFENGKVLIIQFRSQNTKRQ